MMRLVARCFLFVAALLLIPAVALAGFRDEQLEFERVKVAEAESKKSIEKMFKDAGVPFPPKEIYIRIFKKEMVLELWVRSKGQTKFQLLKVYDVCESSGDLGPKRQRGDLQIPEGFYRINHFNPFSTFYLSMGINYPNRSDKILKTGSNPGGSIYIHGDCVTIGCVPITDPEIKQLYWIAVETTSAGQVRIPVHIFPFRFTDDRLKAELEARNGDAKLKAFWTNLRDGYNYFETHNKVPKVRINKKGKYYFSAPN